MRLGNQMHRALPFLDHGARGDLDRILRELVEEIGREPDEMKEEATAAELIFNANELSSGR